MNKKVIILGVSIVAVSFFISSQQNTEDNFISEKNIVDFSSQEWNNSVTKILPRQSQIGDEWIPLWSDSSKTFKQGEDPITTIKEIGKNEIVSTSYNYQNSQIGIIQILVWKGEVVSEWDHENAVDMVLQQVDGIVEKILNPSNLSEFCTMGYYNMYGEENDKFDLLFTECAKDSYRIRINLAEGKYSDESIKSMTMFSNQVIEKIK